MSKNSEYAGDYKLDVFDTYSFLIIGPISALASFVLFFAHVISKELRKQPGDLILMISLCEFVLSMHYVSVAYRTPYIATGCQEDGAFCQFNSYASLVSQVAEFSYSVCFLIHIYFTMNSSIQKGFVPKLTYHVITAVVVIVALMFKKNTMGKDPYGICSIKVGEMKNNKLVKVFEDLIYATVGLLVGLTIAWFVLIYTQRRLPNFGRELTHLRRDFLNYYKTYIKAFIVIWVIVFASFLAQIFGEDQRMQLETNKLFKGYIFDIGRIGNTAKVVMPLLFFFVRIQDPLIRKRMWNPMKDLRFCRKIREMSGGTEEEENLVKNDQIMQADMDDDSVIIPPKSTKREIGSINERESQKSGGSGGEVNVDPSGVPPQDMAIDDDNMFMNLLPAKIKETYTRTFLACIYSLYEKKLLQKRNVVVKNKEEANGVFSIVLKGHKLMKEIGTDKSINDCKFTIYSAAVFRQVIDSSFKKINFHESLDIFKNEDRIKKAGESGGGASGELFMFSHDNQLILKTANNDEINMFRDLLFDYKEYLNKHPYSQISRIYGLFDFSFRESDKNIRLILMENLFTVNPECILRKYDLKGSTHARRRLKKELKTGKYVKVEKDHKVDSILKDLDFLDIDKDIEMPPEQRGELMRIIEQDVEFFRSHEIIDYSMILAVVNRFILTIGQPKQN